MSLYRLSEIVGTYARDNVSRILDKAIVIIDIYQEVDDKIP